MLFDVLPPHSFISANRYGYVHYCSSIKLVLLKFKHNYSDTLRFSSFVQTNTSPLSPGNKKDSRLLQRYFRDVYLPLIVTEKMLSRMSVALAAMLDSGSTVATAD